MYSRLQPGSLITATELREATKRHCLNFLEGWSQVCETPEEAYDTMPLSKLYNQAEAFIAGYKTALAA